MKQEISSSQLQREMESLKNQEKLDAHKVNHEKQKLINELKEGLGDIMKENPSKVEFIQPPKETFKDKIIKFFKRF